MEQNNFDIYRITTDFSGVKIEHQLENRDWETVTENQMDSQMFPADVRTLADTIFGLPSAEIGKSFETLSESYQQAKYKDVDEGMRIFGTACPEFRVRSELKEYDNYPAKIQVKGTWISDESEEGRLSGLTVRPTFRPQGLKLILWDVAQRENETLTGLYPLHGEKNFINLEGLRVKKVFDEKTGTSSTGNDWRLVNIAVTDSKGYEARVSLWNESIESYLPSFAEGTMVNVTNAKITPNENYPPSISLYSTSEVVTA